MDKSVIKHSLLQEPFTIPMKIRKRLPMQKTIFQLNEPQIKKTARKQLPMRQQSQMVDPLVMDSALIKSLLFGKIESYLILLSIIVSGLIVYRYEQYRMETTPNGQNDPGKSMMGFVGNDDHENGPSQWGYDGQAFQQGELEMSPAKYHLYLIETFISVLLLIIMSVGIYFESQTNKTRGLENQLLLRLLKFLIYSLHPNPWTPSQDYLLHLSLLLRLPFMFSYWIKTTTYHNNRSFRLTEIYGIKPSENFMFAIKSIVDEMEIRQVVCIYVFMAFIFSHCLFLAGLSEWEVKPFWSCFEIVIVTLPTIGYGEYYVRTILQRGIILVAVVVGACLNSLITLIMLKQFEMSTQQTFSYNLLHKLELKQRMENLSREYIIETMKQLRNSSFTASKSSSHRRQIDNNFKEQYKYLKARYTEINTRDLNSMFNLFKEQLKEFKIRYQQMTNLVFVLLAKLHKVSYKD